MSADGELASASQEGSTVCQQCGTIFHKANAKFCRRCGGPRFVKGSAQAPATKPQPSKAKKESKEAVVTAATAPDIATSTAATPQTANVSVHHSSGSINFGTGPSVMPPLASTPSTNFASASAITLSDTDSTSANGTLRPLEVRQHSHQGKSSRRLSNGASALLEFRDPGAVVSLTSPTRRQQITPEKPASVPAAPRASSIYARDTTLPELPQASLADPQRFFREHSESSEEASLVTAGFGTANSGSAVPAALPQSPLTDKNNGTNNSVLIRAPVPPREQPSPHQARRPTSASSAGGSGGGHKLIVSDSGRAEKQTKREGTTKDRRVYTVDKAAAAVAAEEKNSTGSDTKSKDTPEDRHRVTDEEEDESPKSLRPSEEEEAQYTAWATLPPDGLTPEMLQTSNAGELRKWRKGSLIGRGTYGSVYLGLLPDGSFYAVKCVELSNRKAAADHLGVLELVSLSREINMMHRLRHRNLCTFKGVYYDAEETVICMFMEYIGGGSLSSLVKRFKPLPPSVVRNWTWQLLTGLQYLHAQHIIHRDVKGDNVLVDTSADPASMAQIKLVDFGAARRLTDAVSQSSTVIGTPYWMAPEVVDAAGDGNGYSYKADVWSVGCTVAEMLTGRPPWPCKTSAPAAIMMIASATGMPTEIPEAEATPGCLEFMRQCFIRDPERRPTVHTLLQHPWIKGKMA